jgi:hypothetical protein
VRINFLFATECTESRTKLSTCSGNIYIKFLICLLKGDGLTNSMKDADSRSASQEFNSSSLMESKGSLPC